MDTLANLRTAVQSDLTVDSTSSLYPSATIDLAINRAYRKVGGLFRWPELEDAKKTSAVSGQDYYDYPDSWQPDSIHRVAVDGVRYGEKPDGSPMRFRDYLNWKEDNPNSTDKKWTSQWRRFFISPVPTANGNNNICVWGQKAVELLDEDADVTIFSYSMREVNEAIVLEAVAILRSKGEDENGSAFRSSEAKQIVLIAWRKVQQNQAKYAKAHPMFNVPNFYNRQGSEQVTGNFYLDDYYG